MTPPTHPEHDPLDQGLLEAVVAGEARLTPRQAMEIHDRMPPQELGRWADLRCRKLHGDSIRTYVIDRNINYTNICTAKCIFCAFKRAGHEDDAYTLEYETLLDKVRELSEIGGTQILMQGGMNPDLELDWYIELLQRIKQDFPQIHVHAFSPPEFVEFVRFFNPPGEDFKAQVTHVMKRKWEHWYCNQIHIAQANWRMLLRNAGPFDFWFSSRCRTCGCFENFAPAVRDRIGMGKCDADSWLTVMRVAHELGLKTSATMMFGHIEGIADRIHHIDQVRTWQDGIIRDFGESGGGRYTAFISWPFQPDNTALGRVKEWGRGDGDDLRNPYPGDVVARLDGSGQRTDHPEFGRRLRLAGASAYLRMQALSRLYLDNIYSIGSSWVTMGPLVGQLALRWGANDMGSVMMEENVVSSAGTTHCLNEPMICRLIRDAGFIPAQRNNAYELLKVHDGENAPDLAVTDWSDYRADRLHVENDGGCGSDGERLDTTVQLTVDKT